MKKKIVWASLCLVMAVLVLTRNSVLGSSGTPDESLLGSDSNKNGIRDDIEDYIQKRFPASEKKRAALLQFAEDYQTAFSVYEDPEKLKLAVANIESTYWCVSAVFDDPATIAYELNSLTAELFNNRKRSLAGIHIDNLRWDLPSQLPPDQEEIKQCRFDPSKMRN